MPMNGPSSSKPEGESPVSSLGLLAATVGVAAILALLYMRFQPLLKRH